MYRTTGALKTYLQVGCRDCLQLTINEIVRNVQRRLAATQDFGRRFAIVDETWETFVDARDRKTVE